MKTLEKFFAKKYIDLQKKLSGKTSSVAAAAAADDDDEENRNKTSANSQLLQQHEVKPSLDSNVKTATEKDENNLNKKPIISNDTSKSELTTSSISSYKRSVSPDTMLRGATSNTSISPRCNIQTSSLISDYSSDLSFFGMKSSTTAVRSTNDILVEYWWDLTPQNIHTIVINYLYDNDNRRCNQCWTFLEKKLGISRVTVFYLLIGAYFSYILSGDLAKFLYHAMGIGYPMYKTYTTYEYHGLNACRSWLRYWVVFGWLAMFDAFFHHYLKHWTIYWSVKIIITIYLLMPLVKGADLIYRDFIKNLNKNIEHTIGLIVGKK